MGRKGRESKEGREGRDCMEGNIVLHPDCCWVDDDSKGKEADDALEEVFLCFS